jgi:hypothetical protein
MVEFQHCVAGTRTEVWYGAVLVKIILQFYVVVTMCYHMVIAFFFAWCVLVYDLLQYGGFRDFVALEIACFDFVQ